MSLIDIAHAQTFNFLNISPTNGTTVSSVVDNLIPLISLLAGILAFVFLVYSGFLYLTANGNPDQAKKGQQGIINAIIGIIIITLAYFIVTAVAGTANQLPTGNSTGVSMAVRSILV